MNREFAATVLAIATVALLAAGEAPAADSCTVQNGMFRVDLVDTSDVSCPLGTCTRYRYEIVRLTTLDAAHAALVFDAFFADGGAIQIAATHACDAAGTCTPSNSVTEILPGETDGFTKLGGELTVQGVRINSASVLRFAVDVQGSGLGTSFGTAAVQGAGKGDKVSACVVEAPATPADNPKLATTQDVCFERNGCKACFTEGEDGLEVDPVSSNIGGPGCEQGGLMLGPAVTLSLPGEASPVALEAIPHQVGSGGGTFGEGSCPFIYTKSDGSIGGFCDCFGVFENGFYVQKDPLSICGPPNGCCTAGPFGGVNNSCGLSPVRRIGQGLEGPLCPAN